MCSLSQCEISSFPLEIEKEKWLLGSLAGWRYAVHAWHTIASGVHEYISAAALRQQESIAMAEERDHFMVECFGDRKDNVVRSWCSLLSARWHLTLFLARQRHAGNSVGNNSRSAAQHEHGKVNHNTFASE